MLRHAGSRAEACSTPKGYLKMDQDHGTECFQNNTSETDKPGALLPTRENVSSSTGCKKFYLEVWTMLEKNVAFEAKPKLPLIFKRTKIKILD